MASYPDGNFCTIETDSEGSIMTPTSSTMRTLVDSRKDNYLNYLPRMPMDLQIEDTDVVIINAEDDVQSADRFKSQLLKTFIVAQDGQKVKPKVKLISEIPGFRQEIFNNIDIAFKKANYIFLFATKSLCDPNSILSRLERVLWPFIEKKNIIPVNTKNKRSRDYNLGPMYSGVKPIEFWSGDNFYMSSVQRLFELKIDSRLKRDRELEYSRKDYYFELQRKEIFGPLEKNIPPDHGANVQPIGSLPKEVQWSECSSSSLQYPGAPLHHVKAAVQESLPSSQIQIDGPTVMNAIPSQHPYSHAEQSPPHPPPELVYGFSEMPHELRRSYTPGCQTNFYRQHPTATSSSSIPSMQRRFCSSQTPYSMEVQPPTSNFPRDPISNSQFTEVQSEKSSRYHQNSEVYYPHYPSPMYSHHPSHFMANPHGQAQFDLSQLIRLPGGLKPAYTMETTYGNPRQDDNLQQALSTSQSTSQKTRQTSSASNVQFAQESSVPQSSSSLSNQSSIFNISINIDKVVNAAIGPNPTLINKTAGSSDKDDNDDDDGDSDSSDCLCNEEKNPGLEERSEKDAPVFTRSLGGAVSTANAPPPSIKEPISASNTPKDAHPFNTQEPPSTTESTYVKSVYQHGDEDDFDIAHQTAVKLVCEDESESGSDEQTMVKNVS